MGLQCGPQKDIVRRKERVFQLLPGSIDFSRSAGRVGLGMQVMGVITASVLLATVAFGAGFAVQT